MKWLLLAMATITTAQAAPALRPGATPPDQGSDRYSPTKCEWLAIELNANYRESKNGYSSYFYCQSPNTMLLSFKYENEAGRVAATQAIDQVRESLTQIAKQRNWRWIKIEEEIVKVEPALAAPKPEPKPLAAAPVAMKQEQAEDKEPKEDAPLKEIEELKEFGSDATLTEP